ncbi:MAG: hypothetical protein KC897_11150 [Candidatus Omnitrophica bacterium]|nr:hypothetical protein [Candidatus Omnitrophota bacterium]MCB9721977.1 hypothetical protein [Candidatus Omnitrophota bacterium]
MRFNRCEYAFHQLTMTVPILLAVFCQLTLMTHGFTPRSAHAACVQVEAGQQIRMGETDCVELQDSGYRLTLQKFHNDPCPENAQCIWSGVGISFQHVFHNQVMEGMDLIQAFDFDITVHDTDNETFAVISIEPLKDE